ncbi:MAG: hypothetical protein UE295_07730 [Acutalibacteraceae bacterium]|nr:hypothetical protein [Acutalibacteraceae bacterium]
MIFELTNVDTSITRLFNPYYMKIKASLSDDTDTLTVTFRGVNEYGEYKYIRVIYDEKTIFTGVIDSLVNSVNEYGKELTLNCRSMSACLLDNHLQPQNMQNITDEIIYARFLQPNKIGINNISNKSYNGVINISNNTSVYDLIKEYSQKVFSALPYVNADGVAILNSNINSSKYFFSNTANPLTANSYYCTSIITENNRRNVVSKVCVKNRLNETGYNYIAKNDSALNDKIDCVRYIDATPYSGRCTYDAIRMIDSSNNNRFVCRVKCPCMVYNPVGAFAIVSVDDRLIENMIVSSVTYTYKNNKTESEIIMYRKL